MKCIRKNLLKENNELADEKKQIDKKLEFGTDCNEETWKSLTSYYTFRKIPRMFYKKFQIFQTIFLKLILGNNF